MKKHFLVFLILISLQSLRAFGEPIPEGTPLPTTTSKPVTFVEEEIPESKTVIYFYSTIPGTTEYADVLLFTKSGLLLTILPSETYFPFITDPGTHEFVVVMGSGGQYGNGIAAKKIIIDTRAGEENFVGILRTYGPKVIPSEMAKTKKGILVCRRNDY
jgi:hypothetical protein